MLTVSPTLDPHAAANGAIAPFGGAKGYGLGLAIELLVAAVTGSAFGREVRGTLDANNVCSKGDLFLCLSPDVFGSDDSLGAVSRYLDALRASPPQAGFDAVRVPGDRARAERARRLSEGVPVADAVWTSLSELRDQLVRKERRMTPYGVLRSPKEIMFGCGSIVALPKVVAQFGSRVLVCTDANVMRHPAVEAAIAELRAASSEVRVLDSIAPDLPLSAVQACLDAADPRTDVVVGLGGGSCMDAAKLVALLLRHPRPLELYYGENAVPGSVVPIVAVPTTAGTGSEVTPVAVVGDPSRQLKVGVSSTHLIPAVAICDPELTLSCPPSVTAFSGIDALAHAVEALTARARPRAWESYPGEIFQGSTELTDDYARRAIRAIGSALERAYADGSDLTARTEMLYGSLCAGLAFGNAGTAGAHALQYPIGAATATPHGLGVGLLLPVRAQLHSPCLRREARRRRAGARRRADRVRLRSPRSRGSQPQSLYPERWTRSACARMLFLNTPSRPRRSGGLPETARASLRRTASWRSSAVRIRAALVSA